jgi:hypothetical protein
VGQALLERSEQILRWAADNPTDGLTACSFRIHNLATVVSTHEPSHTCEPKVRINAYFGEHSFLDRNYSGYLVPTSADIPKLDVLFVGEFDAEASPIGAGLGELTSVSVAPAIANAVYHATGRRIRHLPIAVEDLL